METIHFDQKRLAVRWNVSEATLERWRSEGVGLKFLKLRGRVIYRLIDIKAFEEASLFTSTSCRAAHLESQRDA